MRANWAKFTVRCVKRAGEPLRAAILPAIPEQLRAEIRSAGPLQWIPARVFMDLCDAIRAGAGALGARTFWRQSLREATREPFIFPLVRGAWFLWGKTPMALARRTPQAWQLVARNCGELKAIETSDETTITLRVTDLPLSCRRQSLLHVWEGGMMGQLDAVEAEGFVVTQAEQFQSTGNVDFVIRWKRQP